MAALTDIAATAFLLTVFVPVIPAALFGAALGLAIFSYRHFRR
jgi:hypothetical protein